MFRRPDCADSLLALGLLHEHQRPDRAQTVRFLSENVDPGCSNMPKDKTCANVNQTNINDPIIKLGCCQYLNNFRLVQNEDASGKYDLQSVMHYGSRSFALPKKFTLVPAVNGTQIPESHPGVPSTLDLERICKIYSEPCDKWKKSCKKENKREIES